MAGQLTIDTLKASSGVLATQNGMSGIAKAWVNYNAVAQTIRNSFNVSSVTYNSTGNYTVNFTTTMPDANYNVVCSTSNDATYVGMSGFYQTISAPTTTSARLYSAGYNSTLVNFPYFCATFFGT